MKTKKPLIAAAAITLLLAIPAAADAKTYVGGPLNPGLFEVLPFEHPKRLVLGPLGGSLAEIMVIQRVKWSHWGHQTATAKARHRTKTYDPWEPVRVRAYRRRTCNQAVSSFRVYTRVKTTAYGRTVTWKTPSCSVVAGYMD